MSGLQLGEKLCVSCFQHRQNCAQTTHNEHVLTKNWGLYLIPVISQLTTISKAAKRVKYPDGYDYHVYINGRHEEWSKHKRGIDDLKKCSECNLFHDTYYQLEALS